MGVFLDGIQFNQSDAKQLSFANFEAGAWEMPKGKVVLGAESVPGVLNFPSQC